MILIIKVIYRSFLTKTLNSPPLRKIYFWYLLKKQKFQFLHYKIRYVFRGVLNLRYVRRFLYKHPNAEESFKTYEVLANFILPRVRISIKKFNKRNYCPYSILEELEDIENQGYNIEDFDKFKIWQGMLKKMEKAFFLLSEENKKGLSADSMEIIKDGLFYFYKYYLNL